MKTAKRLKKMFKKATFSSRRLAVFALAFGLIGGYIILHSFAATVTCTTFISPGANVANSFNAMSPGQTLCLHTGVYESAATTTTLNASGTSGNPITLTTVPGEAPATLQGELRVGLNSPPTFTNNVTISHINFKLDGTDNGRVNTQYGCTATRVRSITLTGSNIIFEYNNVSEASAPANIRDTAIGVNYTGVRTSGVIIRYNKIHDFGACDHFDHGIYFDYVDNGQIYGNWIWNGGCAYGLGGDTSKGCGAGIQLYAAPIGTQVYNNIIDGTGNGLYIWSTNNNVHNNVITNIRGMFNAQGTFEAPEAYSGNGGNSTNTFSNNDVFNSGPFCSYCTATTSGNITSDPLFNNAAGRDYTLKAGSPVASWGLWNGDLSNGYSTTPPPPPPAPTTITQTITNGSTLTGIITWLAYTSNDSNVNSVDFYVDGVFRNTETAAPWASADPPRDDRGLVNTTQFSNGSHVFKATANLKDGTTVSNSATATVSNSVNLPGDLNGDGHVTTTDLSILLTNFGTTNAIADINGDGMVTALDLSILLSHFGA